MNADLGLLDRGLADAIVAAATEIVDGSLDGQIVVDVLFQTGSGTSTNMNANEVIANRAIELLWRADRLAQAGPTPTITSTSASPQTT